MGLDHRLGPAGGAAGEEPDRRVVAVGGNVVEAGVELAGDRREAGMTAGLRAADQELGTVAIAITIAITVTLCGLEHFHQIVRHHGAARAARAQEMGQRVGLERRVDHHHDRARLEHAKERADVLRSVGQGDEDALLRAHPEADEGLGKAVGELLDLAVGELAKGAPQGDALTTALGDPPVEEILGDVEVRRCFPARVFPGVHGAARG